MPPGFLHEANILVNLTNIFKRCCPQLFSLLSSTRGKRAVSLLPALYHQGDLRQPHPHPTATPLSLLQTASRTIRFVFKLANERLCDCVVFFFDGFCCFRSWCWCCRTLWRCGRMRSLCSMGRRSRSWHPTSRVRVWSTGPPTATRQPLRAGYHAAFSKRTDT